MKKIVIPYGISKYEEVIENNYLYIDKTQFIEKLDDYASPYKFFLRPRRFGKNPTKEKNGYHVLTFNFSGLRTDTK